MLIIDKPVVTGAPPVLPPYLQKKDRPERRVVILPDICRIEQATVVYDPDKNWKTTVYHWMVRLTGGGMFDPDTKWEGTHTSTKVYRQWLETYDYINDIPPHIQFGGCVVSGETDPTFYPRWCAWAKETFC